MTSRFGVLTIPLLCIVILLAYKNYEIWSQPPQRAPKKIEAKRGEAKPEASPGSGGAAARAPQEPLQTIAERNIFAPDRKEFPVQAAAGEQAKPVARPQVILYGVMIAEEYKTASIANPGRLLFKGERETKTVKLGDRIGDYHVTKILPDRIALEAAGDSFEVLLFDPKSPKKRMEVKTPGKPAEIISTAQPAAPAPKPGTAAIPPAPIPAIPGPVPAAAAPHSVGPARVEAAPAAPATPVPQAADPNVWRGRRTMRPALPAASGTQQ